MSIRLIINAMLAAVFAATLASCGDQLPTPTPTPTKSPLTPTKNPLTVAEAITMAKYVASTIDMPPRMLDTNDFNKGANTGQINSWPNKPGSTVFTRMCGEIDSVTLTTTVSVGSPSSGYDVTFAAYWKMITAKNLEHRWLFHVNSDQDATFLMQDGDDIPYCVPLPHSRSSQTIAREKEHEWRCASLRLAALRCTSTLT